MDADTRNFGLSAVCIIAMWASCLDLPRAFSLPGSNLLSTPCIIISMNELSSRESSPAPDADLASAAAAGEQAAFAELYRRHAGRLLPTLWRLTGGDGAKAEDLLQDTFIQAWRKLDQLREPAAFYGWLKRMAVNLALADKRRLQPVSHGEVPEQADVQPPWPAADMDLERAIARLPDRARQVLVLFHIEGFAHAEIATLMKIEQGTSKAQLHRARGLLKEMLA